MGFFGSEFRPRLILKHKPPKAPLVIGKQQKKTLKPVKWD